MCKAGSNAFDTDGNAMTFSGTELEFDHFPGAEHTGCQPKVVVLVPVLLLGGPQLGTESCRTNFAILVKREGWFVFKCIVEMKDSYSKKLWRRRHGLLAGSLQEARLLRHFAKRRFAFACTQSIAEAQRSLLNCWMVNGYKFRWNMAFCSRIIIDTAWGHLIFSVFSAFRVFTFQEKPRTDKLKNWKKWIPQEKNRPQTSPMEFSFSVFPLLVPQI